MSDLFGVSGRAILTSLIGGEVITETALNFLCTASTTQTSMPWLRLSVDVCTAHRDMIRFSWDHLCFLEQQIVTVEREIDLRLQAYQEKVDLLTTLPGVKPTAATAILAETGPDVMQFPSACYWRMAKRMGKKKTLIALAHTMLRIIYAMLRDNKPYEEFPKTFATTIRLPSVRSGRER